MSRATKSDIRQTEEVINAVLRETADYATVDVPEIRAAYAKAAAYRAA